MLLNHTQYLAQGASVVVQIRRRMMSCNAGGNICANSLECDATTNEKIPAEVAPDSAKFPGIFCKMPPQGAAVSSSFAGAQRCCTAERTAKPSANPSRLPFNRRVPEYTRSDVAPGKCRQPARPRVSAGDVPHNHPQSRGPRS